MIVVGGVINLFCFLMLRGGGGGGVRGWVNVHNSHLVPNAKLPLPIRPPSSPTERCCKRKCTYEMTSATLCQLHYSKANI